MDDDIAEIARKMRRDAMKPGHDAETPVTRRLGGWKLVLSYWRKGGAQIEADARRDLAKMFGQDFVEQHTKNAPKPGPIDPFLFRWHLSASWSNHGEATTSDKKRLADLVVALGIPEKERPGIQPIAVTHTTPQGAILKSVVTHWSWDEPIAAKA